jgi:hypothetical protein
MFMEYHADPTYGVYGQAAHIRTIPPDERVQLIALSDIGAFAALALRRAPSLRGPSDRVGR